VKKIGSVLLVEHGGRPTEWPVMWTGDDDTARLKEIFETAKKMCSYEIAMGGCLKLLSPAGELLEEYRGV
jgi:hypothetical protein